MTDAELPHRSTGPSGVEQAAEPSSLTAMTLRWIGSAGIRRHDPSESHAVLDRTDGFWRLYIPVWLDDAERLLPDEMNCHPLAIKLEEAQRLSAGAPLLGPSAHRSRRPRRCW